MPFTRIRVARLAKEQIRAWALPDGILKEVFLHLTEVMPRDPEHNLSRETSPFDGMLAHFVRRDHYTRGRDHEFTFVILYGADEETLIVDRGWYTRNDIQLD